MSIAIIACSHEPRIVVYVLSLLQALAKAQPLPDDIINSTSTSTEGRLSSCLETRCSTLALSKATPTQPLTTSSSPPSDSISNGFIATGVVAGVAAIALMFFCIIQRRMYSRMSTSSFSLPVVMASASAGQDAALMEGWQGRRVGGDEHTLGSLSRTSTVVPYYASAARQGASAPSLTSSTSLGNMTIVEESLRPLPARTRTRSRGSSTQSRLFPLPQRMPSGGLQ